MFVGNCGVIGSCCAKVEELFACGDIMSLKYADECWHMNRECKMYSDIQSYFLVKDELKLCNLA